MLFSEEKEKLFERIRSLGHLKMTKREVLIDYLDENIMKRVFFLSSKDFELFEKLILKVYNYDVDKIEKMLNVSWHIVNVTTKKPLLPNINHLILLSNIFNKLNIDLDSYNLQNSEINITFSRLLHRIKIMKQEKLNNEISIMDLTNEIYEKYYAPNDINESKMKILKILDKVDYGLKEYLDNEKKVFLSEEINSLFECSEDLSNLNLSNIIKEFYPTFENEIFPLIKRIAESADVIDNNTILNNLYKIQSKSDVVDKKKKLVLDEIKNIDVDTSKSIKTIFSNLIENINKNTYINDDIKEKILKNIDDIFNKYSDKQNEYIDKELSKILDNFTYFINSVIVPNVNRKTGVDLLVNNCLNNCKDFFIEYEGKKFKEIVDYVLENTNLNVDDLIVVSNKCSNIFKDTDIKKLKIINDCLKEFKEYINSAATDNDELINENLLDKILIENPNLLLNNENKIKEIVKFLKGETSLKEYGYKGVDLRFPPKFFQYEFLKKLALNDYQILFNSSIENFYKNLSYIEESCPICNINFRELKISEDMIYILLKNDFTNNNNHKFFGLNKLFSSKDMKTIIENNPNVLTINEEQLDLLIEKSILNENEEYDFFDLLSSELFYFNADNFKDKDAEKILNENFKYIDLNLDKKVEFDATDILTSGLISSEANSEEIWERYHAREEKKDLLDKKINAINKNINFDYFYEKIKEIFELYEVIYPNVPNNQMKNRIIDVISSKIEKYNFTKIDNEESIETEKALLSIHKIEKDESNVVKNQLEKLFNELSSDVIKNDLKSFISLANMRISNSETKFIEISNRIAEIEEKIVELTQRIDKLEAMLLFSDEKDFYCDDNDSLRCNYFTIEGLLMKEENQEEISKIIESLIKNNVVVFSNGAQVDLENIPNDKEIFDKVYKFLGNTQFSIVSKSFMEDKRNNAEFVEKYKEPRSEIWSRREDRTPVRIYFIPVHTKHFTCYYVTGVKYKDHNHLDGGCSSDDAYRKRIKEAKNLKNKIESLTDCEKIIEFINNCKEEYDEAMKPIVSKIDINSKKKK